MKNRKTINGLVEGFFWSIFIGVVGISIGLGAVYPPVNYVAILFPKPGTCCVYCSYSDTHCPAKQLEAQNSA